MSRKVPHATKQLKHPEHVLHKRSHSNEKLVHCDKRKCSCSNEVPVQPIINK